MGMGMSVIRSGGTWACEYCAPETDMLIPPVQSRAAPLPSVFSAAGGAQNRRGGLLSACVVPPIYAIGKVVPLPLGEDWVGGGSWKE